MISQLDQTRTSLPHFYYSACRRMKIHTQRPIMGFLQVTLLRVVFMKYSNGYAGEVERGRGVDREKVEKGRGVDREEWVERGVGRKG